jgi:hypothetical protein
MFCLFSIPLLALLDGNVYITSPCTAATAARLYKGKEPTAPQALQDTRGWHWAALESTEAPVAVDPALLAAPPSIRRVLDVPDAQPHTQPLAVGRLRCSSSPPMIDCLCTALPKEDPQAQLQAGLVIDALLLVWAEHVAKSSVDFDALAGSGSLAVEEALRARGFEENPRPDFTALSRGEPLATHVVRLAHVSERAEQRAEDALSELQSPFAIAHAQSLVDALRRIESKVSLVAPVSEEEQTKRDPWAGIKGFGMS